MKIPGIKNNFGEAVEERGLDYYKEGRVKNLIVDGDVVKATVIGNRKYRVTIDLSNDLFKCTCPCNFNCKHAVAVLYELRENPNIETADNLNAQLAKKSKEELIFVLQKILVSEPRFRKLLIDSSKDIKKAVVSLDFEEDEIDDSIEEIDELHELILKNKDKLDNLVLLFKKCFEIYEDYGGLEEMEDSMFNMLEQISKESKKLPKKNRKELIQEFVDLTSNFDFFHDSIDDKGLNIRYSYNT
ncbi:MAG: SWIM zinc finger family protein [Nanoarchaeota archaeon]|nr:SWIM zinc finger family protein [Nanoarchaeota archaeon]